MVEKGTAANIQLKQFGRKLMFPYLAGKFYEFRILTSFLKITQDKDNMHIADRIQHSQDLL